MAADLSHVKQGLFEQLATLGKAISHANRLLILDILAQAPCPVETLTQKLNLSLANVSKHLQQLKQAGLVTVTQHKNHRIYQLSDPNIPALIQTLRSIAENQIEAVSVLLHQKLNSEAPLIPFNPKQLKQAIKENKITLLDVRPKDEFESGHIPGAINVPIDQLDQQLGDLKQKTNLLVYCRGPYCLWSIEAVEKLQQADIAASRMAEGYPEWQLAESKHFE